MSCAIGFRSCTVIFASAEVSGPAIHTLVMRPMVFGSPRFSESAAAATAPLPPGLLITLMRTGTSFSFSIMVTMARARRSLPPPGPVCTMRSTGLVGFHCAIAGNANASAATDKANARVARLDMSSLLAVFSGFAIHDLNADRVEFLDEGNGEQQRRDGEQHAGNRPEEDRHVPLRHHQRLAQRLLHRV